MSKILRVQLPQVGGDISTVNIYHTAITASNLIAENVSASLLTGSGVEYTVDDNISTLFAQVSDDGECLLTTGSDTSTFWGHQIRYIEVYAVGSSDATVEITSPITLGPTTSSISASIDFRDYSTVVLSVDVSAGYPEVSTFDGWYTEETGGSLHGTDTPITITLNTFTGSDNFYARFS